MTNPNWAKIAFHLHNINNESVALLEKIQASSTNNEQSRLIGELIKETEEELEVLKEMKILLEYVKE